MIVVYKKMQRKQKSIDSFCQKPEPREFSDYNLTKFVQKYKKKSTLFSVQGQTDKFSTESLKLHFVHPHTKDFKRKRWLGRGNFGVGVKNKNQPSFKSLDGFVSYKNNLHHNQAKKSRRDMYAEIKERYSDWRNYVADLLRGSVQGVSMAKMWNVSIVGSLVFGMFLMTFIYRYLGPNASAVSNKSATGENTQQVLGESVQKVEELSKEEKREAKNYEDYVSKIMKEYKDDSENEKKLKDDIAEMVKGYPIENMVPFIAKQDRIVAAFLVAIAKKESAWGKRVPVLNGEDCYNYWGYRGIRKRMGTGGHTCFDSPKDAVETVAKRIAFLVNNEKLDTPEKFKVWKCGYDCSWDSPSAVRKWVQDVDYYFEKFEKFED
jgi:esterase/lipase